MIRPLPFVGRDAAAGGKGGGASPLGRASRPKSAAPLRQPLRSESRRGPLTLGASLPRPLPARRGEVKHRRADEQDRSREPSACHCEERKRRSNPASRATPLDCFAEFTIGPATSGRTRRLAMTSKKPNDQTRPRRASAAMSRSFSAISALLPPGAPSMLPVQKSSGRRSQQASAAATLPNLA